MKKRRGQISSESDNEDYDNITEVNETNVAFTMLHSLNKNLSKNLHTNMSLIV